MPLKPVQFLSWPHCSQATVSSIEPRDYPLHHAAFLNDVDWAKRILAKGEVPIDKQNVHGDTALHVATMMGHKEMIYLLLDANSCVKLKNNQGWNPMVEAISYGNREIIKEMLKVLRLQAIRGLAERKPHLFRILGELPDFYMELKWDFHSWIPLLSRMLPSDVCRIYKCKSSLRMDTSLVDVTDKKWERGDISLLFNAFNDDEKGRLILVDNGEKTYTHVKGQHDFGELDEEVDVLMSSDIVDMHMSTKPITFERAKSGWIFRQEKTEDIAGFVGDFYFVNNMNLITKKRREHLSHEDVKKNKSIMKKFATGVKMSEEDFEQLGTIQHRPSLTPPPKPDITFEEYTQMLDNPVLARKHLTKTSTRTFTAMVAMSSDFPLQLQTLIDILEVLAPFKHINKLRDFCRLKMPPGFPIKLEIPIVPTISAKVTFQNFEWLSQKDLPHSMFCIPKNFRLVKPRLSIS
ncbi:unnamed protein product [Bursaphelenchus xylophilus]|uniref:(pine wood nematode) hypothetical protein n=1 Tax=Bursaphelenchus xylophilus TaxID=6326 RepID=A0A1I7RPD5_BURXY|nr:unnamed protein product [Bursaphelenchus xylophilus]CAG9095841.1 unnamed protein product [Bursaphelenchus xylophilus]